jgi:hypothetical protein
MKNSTIFKMLLTAILIIAFTACGTSTKSNAPGDTVKSLFKTVQNKQFDKTAAFYVTKDGEKLSDEELKKLEGMFGMAAKEYDKKDGIDKIEITEETISEDGNSAKVKYILHFKNGDTDNDTMSLIKVNGDWAVQITNF